MPAQNQTELVQEAMLLEESGTEVTDEIAFPGLAERFIAVPIVSKEETEPVAIPGLDTVAYKSRIDIAKMLVEIFDYRTDMTGFKWRIGDKHIDVSYTEGFVQTRVDTEVKKDELEILLLNILKCRANLTAVEWKLGTDTVGISYLAL